jgi:hypothetical protein
MKMELNKNNIIFACFTRYFDELHNNSNRIHLISTIVGTQENYDENNLVNYETDNKKYYIIRFVENDYFYNKNLLENSSEKEPKYKIYKKYNVTILEITLDEFLGKLEYDKENKLSDMFNIIFGEQVIKQKEDRFYDGKYRNCLFEFKNKMNWSNIVLRFKLSGVDISGGSISKRHVMNTVNYDLITHINKLYNYNKKLILENIYNSNDEWSKLVLSSQFDYKYYRKLYQNIVINYNYSPDLLISLFDNYYKISEVEKYISENVKIIKDLLIYEIEKIIFNKIMTLEKFIESDKFSLSKLQGKKKLNPIDPKINLEQKISVQKKELENILAFKNDIEKIKIHGHPKKIYDLELWTNIHKLANKEIKKDRSYSGKTINKIKFSSIGKRKYSTLNRESGELSNFKNNNINSKNMLLNRIKNIIDKFPINNETQKLIELEIHKHNISLEKNNKNIWKDISNLNNGIKNLLLNSNYELNLQITQFKNKKLHLEYMDKLKVRQSLNDLTQKNKYNILISKIISEIDVKDIISILLGKVIYIMNDHNLEEKYATKIFHDLGKKLKQLYFYNLYIEERNKRSNNSHIVSFENNKNIILKQVEPKITFQNYFLTDWKIENKEFIKYFEDELFYQMLGSFCIELLRDTNLLELDTINNEDKTISYIKIAKEVSKKISYQTIPLNVPNKIPMIVKPKKYLRVKLNNNKTKEILGGYLLNDELLDDDIIIFNHRLKENSIISNNNVIYDTINNMSSVGYKINKDLLNFIRLYNDKFNLTLINSKHPIEIRLENNGGDKLYKRERIELESFKSKRFVQESILALADTFENAIEFFIPVRIDYRGRIYCITDYLNYQSTELAKALLLFSKGEKFSKTNKKAIQYMKIFGANCFGNKLDKQSANDRIKWIDDNLDNILNFENGILIEKAESKLLFIAFCFEYRKIISTQYDEHDYYITHLPIQLDATCNGYQHISMLGMDIDLADKLNIKNSTWDDVPDDFYTLISLYIKGYLKKELNKPLISFEKKEVYERLYDLEIQRKILKKCIMTIPYSTTTVQGIKYLREFFEFDEVETSLKNPHLNSNNINIDLIEINDMINPENLKDSYIKENNEQLPGHEYKNNKTTYWFKYKENPNIKLELNDFKELYFILKIVLYDVAPSLNLITEYLKSIAKICIKANTFIPWILPTGLIIRQSYTNLKEVRISPFNYSKYTFVLKTKQLNKIDSKKNIRALMPNLIHSLDSASLSLLIEKYFCSYENNVKNIFAIHDCFATTCNNIDFVIETLKLIYISIYSEKLYLKELDKKMVEHIQNNIDETFDNNKIKVVTITNSDNKKIKLNYPDVNKFLKNTHDISKYIKASSYIIN